MKTLARTPAKTGRRPSEVVVFAEPLNGSTVHVPTSAHTYEGFRAWTLSDDFPEQGRITYIRGRVYVDLTMEELEGHNKVKMEITRVLANINAEEDLGEAYCDGARIANPEGDVSSEPDALFCLWETLESRRAVFLPKRSDPEQEMVIEGTPDLVVEIISDSSVTKDKRDLRLSYHEAGIPEYWLIDARKKLEFQILHWTSTGYQPAAVQSGYQKSRVFRRQFRLTRARGRMGHWKYQLDSRK
jgi:Uma2 family endonuclease